MFTYTRVPNEDRKVVIGLSTRMRWEKVTGTLELNFSFSSIESYKMIQELPGYVGWCSRVVPHRALFIKGHFIVTVRSPTKMNYTPGCIRLLALKHPDICYHPLAPKMSPGE